MISRLDIEERVREWGLREDVVEKDYVIGWLLWGIGRDPVLGEAWAFKGGTCLKKCYIETYRFSEDLDFTVLPGGPLAPSEVEGPLSTVLERVAEESGIDFSQRPPALKGHDSGRYTAGRVYYIGPRRTPGVASVKLDLSGSEQVVRPTMMRAIAHPYPDALPDPGTTRCYSFDEVFAEKIRALGERGRPRDLFDVVNLYRRQDTHSCRRSSNPCRSQGRRSSHRGHHRRRLRPGDGPSPWRPSDSRPPTGSASSSGTGARTGSSSRTRCGAPWPATSCSLPCAWTAVSPALTA